MNEKSTSESIYIPEREAAICLNCDGFFLLRHQSCPGCGSKHYVPASRPALVRAGGGR